MFIHHSAFSIQQFRKESPMSADAQPPAPTTQPSSPQAPADTPHLTHVDAQGAARMVDVSGKATTARTAIASAEVTARPAVVSAILAGNLPKGEALAVARVAGIQAAKDTSRLIPLCHPLPLDCVDIVFSQQADNTIAITCQATTTARTGVEMEALTGATVAALTLYDMAKSADQGITIGPIRLEQKTGGKRGDYQRARTG
jgi:cyclic pyranopterin phosphate synthase